MKIVELIIKAIGNRSCFSVENFVKIKKLLVQVVFFLLGLFLETLYAQSISGSNSFKIRIIFLINLKL